MDIEVNLFQNNNKMKEGKYNKGHKLLEQSNDVLKIAMENLKS